jgi:hypothetical protein|tara:strand:+ start:475 stop:660 length:186 start_codon:yes stop_codon:yes gene_type:complete
MKGVLMNKATYTEPFVSAPQTYKSIGAYGILAIAAFIVMLLAIYVPETKVIGQGLDYNLVP